MYHTNRTYMTFELATRDLEVAGYLYFRSYKSTFWLILACSSTFAGLANSFVLTSKTREFDLCFGNENAIFKDVSTAR